MATGILPELLAASVFVPLIDPALQYFASEGLLPTVEMAKVDPWSYYTREGAEAAFLGGTISSVIGGGKTIRLMIDGKSFIPALSAARPTFAAALIAPATQKICAEHWSGNSAPGVHPAATAATDVACIALTFGEPIKAIYDWLFPHDDTLPPSSGGAGIPVGTYPITSTQLDVPGADTPEFAALLDLLPVSVVPASARAVFAPTNDTVSEMSTLADNMVWVGNEFQGGEWVRRGDATGEPASTQTAMTQTVIPMDPAELLRAVTAQAYGEQQRLKKEGFDVTLAEACIAAGCGTANGRTPQEAVKLMGSPPVDEHALMVDLERFHMPPVLTPDVTTQPSVVGKSPAEITADEAIAYFGEQERITEKYTPPPAPNPSPQPAARRTPTTVEPAVTAPRVTTQVQSAPPPVVVQPWWVSLTEIAAGTQQSVLEAVEQQRIKAGAKMREVINITGSDLNIKTLTVRFDNDEVGVYLPTGERDSGSGPAKVDAGDLNEVYNRTLRTKMYPAATTGTWFRMPVRY